VLLLWVDCLGEKNNPFFPLLHCKGKKKKESCQKDIFLLPLLLTSQVNREGISSCNEL